MQERVAFASAAADAPASLIPTVEHRRRAAWAALPLALVALAAVVLVGTLRVSPPVPVAPRQAALRESHTAWLALPPAIRLAVSRGVGAVEPAYWAHRSGADLLARNADLGLALRFGAGGVTVTSAHGGLTLALRAETADGRTLAVRAAAPTAAAARVSYRRGAVTEWYANGPAGLEQGFTVARPGAATRSLSLSLALHATGGLHAQAHAGGVDLLSAGHAVLRYGGLTVLDARGRTLPSWMTLHGARLVLHARTAHALFPLRVDPIVQDAVLQAGDGQTDDGFGSAVAVSGSLVAVGAPGAAGGAGAVYLFNRPAGGWADASGAIKLTSDTPTSNDALGASVAISDGSVIAGAPGASVGLQQTGAALVFNKPAGGWKSETESGELTEPGATTNSLFGAAIAADGATVVVGAPLAGPAGFVYVFTEPAGGWASATPAATLKSTTGATLGWSVAISGGTIVAGAPFTAAGQGEADVYTEPAGGWTDAVQNASLRDCYAACPSGVPAGTFADGFGTAVAVNGPNVVVGAPNAHVGDNAGQGAAFVFSEPASGLWQNAHATVGLTAQNGAAGDQLGTSVAIVGATVLASAPDASVGAAAGEGDVYTFTEPPGGWTSQASTSSLSEPAGNADDNFGDALALSGASLVVGAGGATVNGNPGQGAAVVFDGVPTTTVTTTSTALTTATTTTASTTPTPTASTTTTAAATSTTSHATSTSTTGRAGVAASTTSRTYATVTAVNGGPGYASVALRCPATTGKCTAANVLLVLQERFSGNRLVGTIASRVRFKRVIVGSAHVTLTAGARTTLRVGLNATGHALLGARTRIATGVSVTSVGRTLRLATVTITRPNSKKR